MIQISHTRSTWYLSVRWSYVDVCPNLT